MKKFRLDEHPKIETGFKVPEHYFEELPAKVMRRLENEAPVISLQPRRSWIWSAAAILILALALPLLNKLRPFDSKVDSVAIENYLVTQSGISSYEMAELLSSEELSQLQDYQLDDMQIEETLSQQDVEHYIEFQ